MTHALLDTIITAVRTNLPAGITGAYLDGFIDRHRDTLEAIFAETLASRSGPPTTIAARTRANLAAMHLAANPPAILTAAHKQTLRAYMGWGDLSIRKANAEFPSNFPKPDPAGLVHEYYTPSTVTDAVIAAIEPLLPTLNRPLTALEPSAGIGRFLGCWRLGDQSE